MHYEGCICSAAHPAPSPSLAEGRCISPHSCSQWVSTPWPVVTSSSRMISTASIAAPRKTHRSAPHSPMSGLGVATAHARGERPVTFHTLIDDPQAFEDQRLCHTMSGVAQRGSKCLSSSYSALHAQGRQSRAQARSHAARTNAPIPGLRALGPAPLPHADGRRQHAPLAVVRLQQLVHAPCAQRNSVRVYFRVLGSTRPSRSYACSSSSTRPARSAAAVRTEAGTPNPEMSWAHTRSRTTRHPGLDSA